jgi:F-type H+-transporting ATPase subunit c
VPCTLRREPFIYVAQPTPLIDDEIGENGYFWVKIRKKANENRGKEEHMSKKTLTGVFTLILVLGLTSMAMAAVDSQVAAAGMWVFFGIAIACGVGIGLAALGTGIGMGNAINGALQGTARNPEAGGKIMTTMIIGLALIESLCIYALVICFILVFKIPNHGEPLLKILGG